MKPREIIEFGENFIDGEIEDWLPVEYEIIEKNQTGFDGEKGFCDFEIIIKRLSDGKVFKCLETDYGQGQVDYESQWTEVFPKTIKKIIYE